jgi:hypothetical protein
MVPDLWARGVLRFVQKQARHAALPGDGASDHSVARAGGGLELVLCGPGNDRRAAGGVTESQNPQGAKIKRKDVKRKGFLTFYVFTLFLRDSLGETARKRAR